MSEKRIGDRREVSRAPTPKSLRQAKEEGMPNQVVYLDSRQIRDLESCKSEVAYQRREVEKMIDRTPTSQLRNMLTDINICLGLVNQKVDAVLDLPRGTPNSEGG